jgi:hypothetical protein
VRARTRTSSEKTKINGFTSNLLSYQLPVQPTLSLAVWAGMTSRRIHEYAKPVIGLRGSIYSRIGRH